MTMPNFDALKRLAEEIDWHDRNLKDGGQAAAIECLPSVLAAARACVDAGKLEFTGAPSLWHGDNFTMIRIDRVLTDDEVAGVCRVLDAGDAAQHDPPRAYQRAMRVWDAHGD